MNIETPRIITDPEEVYHLTFLECPMLVLSDNVRSWISWRIKVHTTGNYSHAMWRLNQDYVASQDRRFRMKLLKPYLNGYYRVKFWWNPDWLGLQRLALRIRLLKDIREAAACDLVGIIGHRIGLPWFNLPNRGYCSEKAGETLRIAEPGFQQKHPSPGDIDRWCKAAPQMKVWGIFDPTL